MIHRIPYVQTGKILAMHLRMLLGRTSMALPRAPPPPTFNFLPQFRIGFTQANFIKPQCNILM